MRVVLFTHSLISDWNHGNAHFLRGVLRELDARGHVTLAMEPQDGWSRTNLRRTLGEDPEARFSRDFPGLRSRFYRSEADLEEALDGTDLVLVHEWTDPGVVTTLGELRRRGAPFTLLFHDTHHRAVSRVDEIAALDLEGYDGVLAFGEQLAELYRRRGWGNRVFTWHEAADTRLFRPLSGVEKHSDLIWIGNWGDGERTEELREFLVRPAAALRLRTTVHGVRYPGEILDELTSAGIEYRGWIANADVPAAFAAHRVTVHIPRRPYVEALPGIPTIRVFEALACGIPLVCAPWEDSEGLFRAERDYLKARSRHEMQRKLQMVLSDADLARELSRSGLDTIRRRHTCSHRVDELFTVLSHLGASAPCPSHAADAVQ